MTFLATSSYYHKSAKIKTLFIIETIIAAFMSTIIPLPFLSRIVKSYLFLLIGTLFMFLTFFILTFLSIVTIISPSFLPGMIHLINDYSLIVKMVENYTEPGISATDIPQKNPLGGIGFENAEITMNFYDKDYHFFNGIHTGIDVIPSQTYYQKNQAYRQTKQIIVFATMDGVAQYFIDQFGANAVLVSNSKSFMQTLYLHLAQPFVSSGQNIIAGQPIGIMGQTGEATGIHLHYEIRKKIKNAFIPVDPKLYIQ